MELDWGALHFLNDEEYFETLGFLSKDEKFIRIYIENNDKSGAWASQGRMRINISNIAVIPRALKAAFSNSSDGRISVTKYVRNLIDNHGFQEMSEGYSITVENTTIDVVLDTVPEYYQEAFNRGLGWNMDLLEHIRLLNENDINYDFQSNQLEIGSHVEGKKRGYYTTKYERNPQNRAKAIQIHGLNCNICGFNFEEKYGALGKGFIEVHHIKPLSELEEETEINPDTDMICVCSNCHRMLHRFKSYIISVEELKELLCSCPQNHMS